MSALRRLDEQRVRRVEREEPDPGPAVEGDVGAHVELEEGREAGDGRQPAQAKARQPERDDPEPGLAVERVERQLRRQQPGQLGELDPPVGEQGVLAGLRLLPVTLRKRPRTVGQILGRLRLPRRRLQEAQVAHGLIVQESERCAVSRPSQAAAAEPRLWTNVTHLAQNRASRAGRIGI